MKLRQKIIFLAIVPLCLAFAAIALVVRYQAVELARQTCPRFLKSSNLITTVV